MNYKIKNHTLIIFILILTLNQLTKASKPTFSFECLIQNAEYGFEFMYHSSEIFNFNRSATSVYVYPLEHLSNLDRVRWLIQSTRNSSNLQTVLIKSFRSNRYLCASNGHLERFMKRRKVYLSNHFEKETCEWMLEDAENNSKEDNRDQLNMKSYITNVKYKEGLYAPSYFFKRDKFKRNLYLWFDKNEKFKSRKFNWIIDCSNIHF